MLTENFLRALAWTLVHSLWQGLVAAVIVALIVSMTKRSPARLRYNLLGMVMLLFIISTLATFFIQYSNSTVETVGRQVAFSTISANEIIVSNANWKQQLFNWFDSNSQWVLLVWSVFFLLYCIKLITGLVSIERLRSYQTYNVSEEWKEKLLELQQRVGIKRIVRVLESRLVKVPVALGFLKPVILLPIGLITQLTPEQVETILLHELSHIRRRDYLVNVIQHFFEAIFFFNPAFVWISSLLRQEREACCDDMVVELSGQRREYLDALVGFQEFAIQSPAYAMGLGSRKEYLLKRVKRILTRENYRLAIGEKLALAIAILLLSAFTLADKKDEIRKLVESPIILPTAIQAPLNSDTIPKKKPMQPAKAKPSKEVIKYKPTAPKADTVRRVEKSVKEIEAIKKDIQGVKDEIGIYKEKYKSADSVQKKAIYKDIEAKRFVLEMKRVELNQKRVEVLENQKEKQHQDAERKKNESRTIESRKNEDRRMNINKSEQRTFDSRKEVNRTIDTRKSESRTIEPRKIEPRTTVKPRKIEPGKVEPRTIKPRTIDARTIEPRTINEVSGEWELENGIDWQIDSKYDFKYALTKEDLKLSKVEFKGKVSPPQKVAPGKPGNIPPPVKKAPPAISYQ